jgi:outer membrane lipoprotein-sorting protein
VKKTGIFLWLIVVFVLAAILLPGCSGGSSASSAAPAASSPAASASKPAASQPAPASSSSQAPASSSAAASAKPTSDTSLIDILKKKDSVSSVSYEAVISGITSGSQKVWLKKTKMRMESNMGGMQSITFMDMEKRTAINYSPSTNMATKMDFNQFASSAPENSDALMKYNPKIVGIEPIDGKLCTVIQYTNDQATTKQWIWQEKGFPLRVEMTSSAGKIQMDMKNIDFSDIADSMFALPAGVTVTDMGQMTIPTGIPNIPGIPTNIPNIPKK